MGRLRAIARFGARRFVVNRPGMRRVVVRSRLDHLMMPHRHAQSRHRGRHSLDGQDERNNRSNEAKKPQVHALYFNPAFSTV